MKTLAKSGKITSTKNNLKSPEKSKIEKIILDNITKGIEK